MSEQPQKDGEKAPEQADPLAAFLAALDLAETAPRDKRGRLTKEGKAMVKAAMDQAKAPPAKPSLEGETAPPP